jgi:extradiol dioxygenase
MELRSLGYVGVETTEGKVWEEIGPRTFGFGVAESGEGGDVYLRLDDRHHRIAVHSGTEDRLLYLGWEVAGNGDLEEAVNELERNGVPVTAGSPEECAVRRVERMVHLQDPAGLRHEIFWGATEKYKSFQPGRPHGGFVTGEQGLGHVVLVAPDGDTMHEFLIGLLGFKLTDVVAGPLGTSRFYRLNSRHHSLAVLSIPGMAGLHHVMVEVNDLDDVGITNDLVEQRIESHDDLAYHLRLGRHSTDRMVSMYVETPSGFIVEYGWGGLQIDDSCWSVVRVDFPAEVWGHKFVGSGMPSMVRPVGAFDYA